MVVKLGSYEVVKLGRDEGVNEKGIRASSDARRDLLGTFRISGRSFLELTLTIGRVKMTPPNFPTS